MKHRSEDQIKLLRTEQEVVFYQELLSPISWEKTLQLKIQRKKRMTNSLSWITLALEKHKSYSICHALVLPNGITTLYIGN